MGEQALGAVCRAGRGRRPSTRAASSVVCRLRRPSGGVISRSPGSRRRAAAHGEVGQQAGGDLPSTRAGDVPQHPGHVRHPQELAGGEEAFARRGR
ncbi:hypothetical protein ACWDFR_00485 [Streptomyces sp. 900105755]|uniref:hypothetical protein n=1 Tax=Streptomyces sp. NPDC001507 TaxID=3364579 RepID=UPI0036966990